MKIVLFGPPGVGKSTAAQVFVKKFNFNLYEADDDYSEHERRLITNRKWTDDNRKLHLTRMAEKIVTSPADRLVIPSAMTKQWMRDVLQDLAGPLDYVLVKTTVPKKLLEELVSARHSREHHPISVEAFRFFTDEFEAPLMPHFVLENPHQELMESVLEANVAALLTRINN